MPEQEWTLAIREVAPPADAPPPIETRMADGAWSGVLNTDDYLESSAFPSVGGVNLLDALRQTHGEHPTGTFTVSSPGMGQLQYSGAFAIHSGYASPDPDDDEPWSLSVGGANLNRVFDLFEGREVVVTSRACTLTRFDPESPRYDPDVEAQIATPRKGHKPGEWVRMPRSEALRGAGIVRHYAEGHSLADRVAALEAVDVKADFVGWLDDVQRHLGRALYRVQEEDLEDFATGVSGEQLDAARALGGLLESAGTWLGLLRLDVTSEPRTVSYTVGNSEG